MMDSGLILVTAMCTLATAMIGLVTSLRNRKILQKNTEIVQQLDIRVNGRLEEFMALIKTSSFAEGVIEGKENSKKKPLK